MKILILNGSPRKGNTETAIQALMKGISSEHQVEVVDTHRLQIAPCKVCKACENAKGCVDKDDSNMILDKIMEADMLIFASPIYWFNISAQLKLVIDKFYARYKNFTEKKTGCIIIGAEAVTHPSYRLIMEQFQCMEEYLGWTSVFRASYSAWDAWELAENQEALEELTKIGETL